MPRRLVGVLGVLVLVLLGACGDDGTELAEPKPGATAPPRTTESTQAAVGTVSSTTVAVAFRLTSGAFAEGGAIPLQQSCDGDNLSPPLAWSGVPTGTVELALTVTDPDADGFIHWVVWGLDPASNGIPEGQAPAAARQATNQRGTAGWFGPCPPAEGPHDYVFTLHALSSPLDLQAGADAETAKQAVDTASAATAVLTGTYERA